MSRHNKLLASILGGAMVIVGLLTLACAREPRPSPHPTEQAKLKEARENLAKEIQRQLAVTGHVAGSLKKLSDQQIAAVVALSQLRESAALAYRSNTKLPPDTATRFSDELATVSSDLSRMAAAKPVYLACFDQGVACASALKKCQDEGKKEEECYDSWGPCSQEVVCMMRELEALRGRINDIFGRLKPPRPIPWPE